MCWVWFTSGYYIHFMKKSLREFEIYLSIGINVRFAAMMADVGDGLL